jgi:glucan phosphoethanolaminetransferase (alkaline phosphatase superfamily)
MRIIIYISGITGSLLIVIRIIGTVVPIPFRKPILYLGLLSLVMYFLFLLINTQLQNKKTDKIIASYKDKTNPSQKIKSSKIVTNAWGMNNSPFRERKSIVTWGGGNIKGALPTRGKRKSFLQ